MEEGRERRGEGRGTLRLELMGRELEVGRPPRPKRAVLLLPGHKTRPLNSIGTSRTCQQGSFKVMEDERKRSRQESVSSVRKVHGAGEGSRDGKGSSGLGWK